MNAGYFGANRLQDVVVKVLSARQCKQRDWYGNRFHKDTMLCAGYTAGKMDACQGDSGGPLQCFGGDSRWRLFGIVSFGDMCGLAKKPGIYTRIETMLGWIKSYIERAYGTLLILFCVHVFSNICARW